MRVRSDRLLRSAGVVGTVPSESMQLTFSKSPVCDCVYRACGGRVAPPRKCMPRPVAAWSLYLLCRSIQLTLIATDELDNFNRY